MSNTDSVTDKMKRRGFLAALPAIVGIGASSETASAQSADKVYSASHDNNVRAHEKDTGNVVWAENIGSIALSVAVKPDGSVVYAGDSNGNVYALDAEDGSQNWSKSIESNELYDIHIDLGGDKLYTTGNDGNVAKVDLETQTIDWTTSVSDLDYLFGVASNPEYPYAYSVGEDNQITLLDSDNGDILDTETDYNDPIFYGVDVPGHGEYVYYGAGIDAFMKEKDFGGSAGWKTEMGSDVEEFAATYEDWIYLGTDGGNVAKLDAENGSIDWESSIGGEIRGVDITPGDSQVFTGSYNNTVKALDVETGDVTWTSNAPTDWVNKVATVDVAPPEPEPPTPGLLSMWYNYEAMVTAIVGAYALIGAWSRSLTLAAWAGYTCFLIIAFATGTEIFTNIALVTLVMVIVGFAFKFTRSEISGGTE